MIYEHDPDMAPDADFERGELHHLIPGTEGRMLDRRRTPVRITGLQPEFGTWTCEVLKFEDAGATWELPFEKIVNFQFPIQAPHASAAAVETFEEAVRKFDRDLEIDPDPRKRERSLEALKRRSRDAVLWIREAAEDIAKLDLDHSTRKAPARIAEAFEAFMREKQTWALEGVFAETFVSNPGSGECVKGHEIVIAEMGFAPYRGTIVRNPATFHAPWTRARRADHILWRMAFVQALLAERGVEKPLLFRGVSSETPLRHPAPAAFVSATFSHDVAADFYGKPDDRRHAVLMRQLADRERVFMTYLETAAMNRHFLEAEAVLVGRPPGALF
jgi:hypothetical protein